MALTAGLVVFGITREWEADRTALLHAELRRLRVYSSRTIDTLRDLLEQHRDYDLLAAVHEGDWLRTLWNSGVVDESRLYRAIVDDDGHILIHTRPEVEGRLVRPASFGRHVDEGGEGVAECNDSALTGGRNVYDLSVPIRHGTQTVGYFHAGLGREWFDGVAAAKHRATTARWAAILGVLLAVHIVAGYALFHISRRVVLLRQAVELNRVRRFAELGQLLTGIAHEIRNPLNAMRLNLHVLDQMHDRGGANASAHVPSEHAILIHETNREIERVDRLMKVLLGYARPEKAQHKDVDVCAELTSTLEFMRTVMDRDEVRVRSVFPDEPLCIHLDPDRLRQIALNLLNNAREATGPKGEIEVCVERAAGRVDIVVRDNGPGVPAGHQARIFEPFFSTKELGTGLGLPMVKRFVEDAGGTVKCLSRPQGGAEFRLSFPEVAVAEEVVCPA